MCMLVLVKREAGERPARTRHCMQKVQAVGGEHQATGNGKVGLYGRL